MNTCKHCFVSGRVQGVSFRYYTQQKAKNLNLTGWVRNLPDRRVEVWVCGEMAEVEKFCRWLHQGPAFAQVIDVQCQTVATSNRFDSFDITG